MSDSKPTTPTLETLFQEIEKAAKDPSFKSDAYLRAVVAPLIDITRQLACMVCSTVDQIQWIQKSPAAAEANLAALRDGIREIELRAMRSM